MRFQIVIKTTTQQIDQVVTVTDEGQLPMHLSSYGVDPRDLLFVSITRLT